MAGYDISGAQALAAAQVNEVTAPTVINFGDKANQDGGWYSQTATPSASATAARNLAGDTQASGVSNPVSKPNWLLIGGITLGAVATIGIVVYLAKKKG